MLLKQPIEVNPVEDYCGPHPGDGEVGPDPRIEEPSLDAEICDRLLPVVAAFFTHDLALSKSKELGVMPPPHAFGVDLHCVAAVNYLLDV
jgi:hypothetical protein